MATATTVVLAPVGGGTRRQCLSSLPMAGAHPSPNAGLIEAAFGGALDIRLGGTNTYAGRIERRPSLGIGGRSPSPTDVARAVRLSSAVTVATAVVAVVLAR